MEAKDNGGEGLVSFMMWVTSGGCEVDGDQLQKQHTGSSIQALYPSSGLKTLAWSKLLAFTGKKLAFGVYSLHTGPSPYIHPASTHVMNETRPSLFFAVFRFVYILYWTQTIKQKNGGGLGTRLLLSVSTFNYERAPIHVYSNSMPSRISLTTMYKEATSAFKVDGTQHSGWHHVTLSMV